MALTASRSFSHVSSVQFSASFGLSVTKKKSNNVYSYTPGDAKHANSLIQIKQYQQLDRTQLEIWKPSVLIVYAAVPFFLTNICNGQYLIYQLQIQRYIITWSYWNNQTLDEREPHIETLWTQGKNLNAHFYGTLSNYDFFTQFIKWTWMNLKRFGHR